MRSVSNVDHNFLLLILSYCCQTLIILQIIYNDWSDFRPSSNSLSIIESSIMRDQELFTEMIIDNLYSRIKIIMMLYLSPSDNTDYCI